MTEGNNDNKGDSGFDWSSWLNTEADNGKTGNKKPTANLIGSNFRNYKIDELTQIKSFTLIVMLVYFGSKAWYQAFKGSGPYVKTSELEMKNFATTFVMAIIVFYATGLNQSNMKSVMFALGLFLGANMELIVNKYTPSNEVGNPSAWRTETIIMAIMAVFAVPMIIFNFYLSFQDKRSSFLNYALYITVIALTLVGIMVTRNTKIYNIQLRMGFLAWIFALTMTQSDGMSIIAAFQGVLLGVMISTFSMKGPEYILEYTGAKGLSPICPPIPRQEPKPDYKCKQEF